MDKIIMKYNPAFLSPEELVDSFVVRHGELQTIIRIIKENVTKSNQHVLAVGPRGIGKTTLLLRVVEEIKRDNKLSRKWYPLVFSEESYSVSTCGEFWLEALFHLARQTKEESWRKTYEELREEKDESRLRERAIAQLMDFADEQDKRIMLVVENLNMLFGDQITDEDGWALRHTLLNESRIMLLASAISRFEEVELEGKPMFELFRFLELKPLDEQECRLLWASVTGKSVDDKRVRPLQILTGGNPRLLAIVATFAANMSLKDLIKDLIRLVDEHTEYFKSHLDNLPPIERKVYIALAEIWDPASARKVAELARLDVSKTSSLLKRLIERGAVMVANGKGRSKLYQVAERMYNIYHLMRHQRESSGRVRAIVNFMVSFYGPEELVSAARSIAEEACGLTPTERTEHYMAYEGVVAMIGDNMVIHRIIRSTPRDFFKGPTTPVSLKEIFENFEEMEVSKRIINLLEKFEKSKIEQKVLEKEEKYFRNFVREHPKSYGGLVGLGTFLETFKKRYEEAEKIYREAMRKNPQEELAALMLSYLFLRQERFEEAEHIYEKAVDLLPEQRSERWISFGSLCEQKERFDFAERAYRKAVESNPKDKNAWFTLGTMLGIELKRYEDSIYALNKAVKIDPKYAGAWNNLGLALEDCGKYEESERAFRKALRLEKKSARILANLGGLLFLKRQYEEAEKYLRGALKLEPGLYKVTGILILLLLLDEQRQKKGFELLRKITEDAEIPKKDINFSTELFIYVATVVNEQEVLEILQESPWAKAMESVVVALRLILGEDIKAAAEIMEVAKDVVKRIKEVRKSMSANKMVIKEK